MCIKKINSWLTAALFALFASGAPGFVSGGGNIAIAQSQYITGTVVDDLGEPVIGANIRVSGTTKGTITDIDGKFSLDVSKGETLEVSFVGYNTQKVAAAPGMVITLTESSEFLEDVVVIGYGVQK
ncbi:MAG: carboxypeptidase-like regulatory domain-containing protein [Bacteroides sp.]|nr:carboxypeptidase-like regulatory domain-containing protein [Bacteroides sp.]